MSLGSSGHVPHYNVLKRLLASSAAGAGSELLAFNAFRTVYEKLRDSVSVVDYGATGDGVTDDSAAIQAAVDANPGRKIYMPQGTYYLGTTILQDTTGLGDIAVCQFVGDGMTQTIIDNQTGGPAFKVTSGAGAEFAYNFCLFDLRIMSTGALAGTTGVEMEGCRFVTFERLRVDGMASHGIYGYSTVGDLTDTAQVAIRHVQVEDCGGYGIYAKTDGDAIQYNWNTYECRVGNNTLGGILGESLTNSEFKNTGVYYNGGFGIRVTTGTSGAPQPKLINIEGCELDTNEGVQIDLVSGHGHSVTMPYLIDNNLTPAFTKGIEIGTCASVVISQATPRMNPAVTGKIIVEVGASSTDIVIRDSDYQGWSVLNGTFYVDNTAGEVSIDDRLNRVRFETGTYTAELRDSTKAKVSATTVTAHYTINNNLCTVTFRDLNDVDLSAFSAGDLLGITLPAACKSHTTASSIGSCIITSDTGTGAPYPVVSNGGDLAVFGRAGTAAFLFASQLTTGTSDVAEFTLTYMID